MLDERFACPKKIYSIDQVRTFDRHAIEDFGIDSFDLMQRAGRAALEFLTSHWPDAGFLVIYCGAGNNAGDGYVLAAMAKASGLAARVVAVIDPDRLAGDAAKAHQLAKDAGIDVVAFGGAFEPDGDLIVDALLGSGMTRPVDGRMAEAVRVIDAGSLPALSLDIPTGIDGDTGSVQGVAVRADATITFVGLKAGLFLGEGPAFRGHLAFSDLGLPAEVCAGAGAVLERLDESDSATLLRPRKRTAHKGTNGRVLIVGGAAGMAGAARLAAEAALRAGAGLVHAVVAPASVASVMGDRPEIMCQGVADPSGLGQLAAGVDVIVVGPGLGRDAWGQSMADALLGSDTPIVADADALNYLAEHRRRRRNWVLTPHPAEAGRLLGCSTAEIQALRREAAIRLAREFGAIAVLKGACSLVSEVSDKNKEIVSVCDYGNPGMATGGTGDVLAGLLGGLIAQFGLSRGVVEAGVLIHALAGDDAARDGERGLIATDLMAHIRRRVNPG